MAEELLKVENLVIRYDTDNGVASAVNDITFSLNKGETLGLVGETGAGKTTTALGIMRLLPDPSGKIEKGKIFLEGLDLLTLSNEEMRKRRGKDVAMIFQDPMTALDPVIPVGDQIIEMIKAHQEIGHQDAEEIAYNTLEMVGISRNRSKEYPHQFSGGMKQRVVIAIALACRPKLLIADEPTTALDVTIQAQVLNMMRELKQEIETSMILITHDLGVVANTCDKVAIMYAGEIIEYGNLEQIYDDPRHPYTIGLFGSIPNIHEEVRRLTPIEGLMPEPYNLPKGCKFHERCPRAEAQCSMSLAENVEVGDGHYVRCHLWMPKGRDH